MSSHDLRVAVCIPAFNEEERIADVIRKARSYATEVIVYDDGSSDNTAKIAEMAGAIVKRNKVNKGYGAAIKTLFQIARERNADVMVTMDSDGQHDADQIPRLLHPILMEGFDMVIGSRFLTEGDRDKVPKYRSLGVRTITRFTQVVSYRDITDAQSGFRAYSKNALLKIDLIEEGMAISTEILVKAKEKNLSIKEVPVTISYDMGETSTHNPFSHGLGVLTTVVRFISLRHPLAFYGIPGMALLIVSAFFLTSALNLFSETRSLSTNMILIFIGSAITGVILLVTGILLNALVTLLNERR